MEVVRADPAYRRRAILAAVGAVVLLLAAAAAAPRLIGSLGALSTRSREEAVALFAALVVPLVVLAAVVGVDTIRRALRILHERRFPPAGMRVLRDTPVIRGTMARVLGVLLCALGATLLAATVVLAGISYRIGSVFWYGCPRAAVSSPRRALPRGSRSPAGSPTRSGRRAAA